MNDRRNSHDEYVQRRNEYDIGIDDLTKHFDNAYGLSGHDL